MVAVVMAGAGLSTPHASLQRLSGNAAVKLMSGGPDTKLWRVGSVDVSGAAQTLNFPAKRHAFSTESSLFLSTTHAETNTIYHQTAPTSAASLRSSHRGV